MISDSYNVRSWLTGISGDLFTEVIRHEDSSTPRWGGKISETSWRNPGETSDRGYVYRYDGLSRLTAAEYADASGSGLFTEGYGYDLNGNMTSRTKAVQLTDSSGNTTLANLVARNSYTGKELATETGLYDFCARYLETSMGRFTTIDPLAEKYPSVSPYAYCAGDPVNRVDPDGRKIYDADGNVVTYDLKNGWSSNADPIFVEIASLMQKYHSGSAIINSMLSSQVKYTVTFIDTLFPENSKKMGENKVTYKKDDKGDASSIVSCDITISTNAIEGRKEKNELSSLEYTAGILAHEWGHGTVSNVNLPNDKEQEDHANIPMNNFFNELLMISLKRITWKPDGNVHIR